MFVKFFIIVLIESDWNLKIHRQQAVLSIHTVLIESDWNLKEIQRNRNGYAICVLIESDWNLKTKFKDALNLVDCSINRIRLEFKGNFVSDDTGNHAVLIESDWNLKKNGTYRFTFVGWTY